MKIPLPICCFICGISWFLTPQSVVGQTVSTPIVKAVGYDSHVELTWSPIADVTNYQIWRSANGGTSFDSLKTISDTMLIDFARPLGTNISLLYKVKAVGTAGSVSNFSTTVLGHVHPMPDDSLMEMVQRYTFRYFRELQHPASGMARERNNADYTVTTGGTGFGVMAWIVAIERGWVSRTEGVDYMLKLLSFLQISDRFGGVFPHWIDGRTGRVQPFSQYDNGGDLVETSFLIQGLLTARQYFTRNTPEETTIRQMINEFWQGVNWNFYRKNNENVLYWHYSPNYQWRMNFQLRGYFEALITYILAVASPTYPIPATVYHQGWAGSPNYRNGQTYYGHTLQVGPYAGGPLFFAHYSFLGFDPRRKKDAYANYWHHNVAQTMINWEYCKNNPTNKVGYSADNWGLTASDDPTGYLAHAPFESTDNGTISPTAALSSMPYAPEQGMRALKYFYREQGAKLWGKFGFYDAFNLGRNWYATSTLAIDQGPIIGMIENHRTGLLWRLFMSNPEIKPALDAMGFVADATNTKEALDTEGVEMRIYPNPMTDKSLIMIDLKQSETACLDILDITGRTIKTVFQNKILPQGQSTLSIETQDLASGFYMAVLRGSHFLKKEKLTKL
ncbi:MAG: T9SS type A sorting domain-containing protein [Saprospiraceae bacterium]|nr:T9SS type A sorting domain-containing protein [Saprospiraceae bacterium]